MCRRLPGTAIGLFVARDFENVPAAKAAEAAEVSEPTLFRCFPAVEDLVLYRPADHEPEAVRTGGSRRPARPRGGEPAADGRGGERAPAVRPPCAPRPFG